MLSSSGDVERRYVEAASRNALQSLAVAGSERDLGSVDSWTYVERDDGVWLKILFSSPLCVDGLVEYERVILPVGGPDKDPETAGMIYSTSFEERLRTRRLQHVPDSAEPRIFRIV